MSIKKYISPLMAVCAMFANVAIANADDSAEKKEVAADPAMEAELKFVNALIENGYSDFATDVIENAKKRWPSADVKFFAAEISSLLGMGKYQEAERRIAALPDRSGSKYWAARLELANNYARNNRKSECVKIYDEFFKKFATPPKDLIDFYLQACYAYGQILLADNRLKDACGVYEGLLKHLKKADEANWCLIACETSDIYIKLSEETKNKKEREAYLQKARKIADEMIWMQHMPVYFGRAIAMKAHVELLLGNVLKAQQFVSEYMPMLKDIHETIRKADPDNSQGLIKLSPMPQCRFMLAEMLWREAEAEYKAPKRSDEKVKTLLFGAISGTRRDGSGAYNHALNVFINHPESSWSAKAGELADKIENFVIEKYKAKIEKRITPEQIRKVREMQFKTANELFMENEYVKALAAYDEALSKYPEGLVSISAIENMISCYMRLLKENQGASESQKNNWRINCDAVEGYLAERFGGNPDKSLMIRAGDAVQRVAALEKQFGDIPRSERLYKSFLRNYSRHINAPGVAAGLAGEAFDAKDWEKAIEIYRYIITAFDKKNTYYNSSNYRLYLCYENLGQNEKAFEYLNAYIANETNPLRKMQSQMVLAKKYQIDGLAKLKSASTNETPELVNAAEVEGSKQIIRGIIQLKSFAKKAEESLKDATVSAADKKSYAKLREQALYLTAECWGALTKPADKIAMFRTQAIEGFESYVKEFPEGEYSKRAYVRLGAMYTATGDIEKSKEALARLAKFFPDSDEAKNAKPRLARNLMEMGLKDQATEIYAEMLKTDGNYTAYQFLNAGDALIDARNWDLANQAFEKAVKIASTNHPSIVARARLGQAKSYYRQKNYADAREALDLFLEDKVMSRLSIAVDANFLLVEVASEQGRKEKDNDLRKKYFGAAISALKKVRTYWQNEPAWKQDETYIMSAEIMKMRSEAEENMGLKEESLDSCERAATTLQAFLQSHKPNESRPIEVFEPGERKNLERCYVLMVELFSKLGKAQAEKVLKFGTEYLTFFPEGTDKQKVLNCINQAKAEGAVIEESNAQS